MINVENLIFDYPMKRGLDNISFRAETGTITAVVGPTGAGKTTLLRIISGLVPPLEGRIMLDEINIHTKPRHSHDYIGFLQDTYGTYQDLTVRQNLWFFAATRKIPVTDRNDAIEETAACLQISDLLDREAKTLSKGQKQKLAIGQVIIHHPRVLLLDEPIANLDHGARRDFYNLLISFQQKGMTLMVSSHILNEIEYYATNMIILKNGKLVEYCVVQGKAQHAEAQTTRRLKILLSVESEGLTEVLDSQDKVSEITQDSPRKVSFNFKGNQTEQNALLRELLELGIPIYSLDEVKKEMSDYYTEKIDKP